MRLDACAWLIYGAATLLLPAVAAAAPLIEVDDRLEVNWSTLQLRFFGEAAVPAQADGYKTAEKEAWHEGVTYAAAAVRALNATLNEQPVGETAEGAVEGEVAKASKQLASAIHSVNTTYFADGTVRVQLESALAKALVTSGVRFRQHEAAETVQSEVTGIVLKSAASTKPKARYEVVDENGELLFGVHDLAQEAYKKNLMGRWFRRPTGDELTAAVGPSPVTIPATAKDGRFVVDRHTWDEALNGHRSLLVNGTIAVALP